MILMHKKEIRILQVQVIRINNGVENIEGLVLTRKIKFEGEPAQPRLIELVSLKF
jgi:hypothetical protein